MRSRARFAGAVLLILSGTLVFHACAGAPSRPTSLILIVVDTLRADHLGTYGYVRPTSPALDAWAARGALLENGWSSSPWTLPSFASIYTGRLPSEHGGGERLTRTFFPKIAALGPSVPTLAGHLTAHGFATAAIVNNPFLAEGFGIARGFDLYDAAPTSNLNLRRAEKVVDRALAWLAEHEAGPFLLVVHFFEPHMEYHPSDDVRGRFTGEFMPEFSLPVTEGAAMRFGLVQPDDRRKQFIAGAYDEEVLSVDIQLGRFLEELEQRRILDKTLVVFTADHGEELWDHDRFEHGHSVYQEVVRVPFVFWGPGVRPARIETPVSHVDILPTALDALAIPAPEGLTGVSLWPLLTQGTPLPDRSLVSEGTLYGDERKAILRWPWKLATSDGKDAPALFDLAQDPAEKVDLSDRFPDVRAELLRELQEREISGPPRGKPKAAAPLDPVTLDRLKSLGYFTGQEPGIPLPSE